MHKNQNKNKIRAVLFDFDGTLFDTAPHLASALNALRHQYSLPPLALDDIRPYAGHGSRHLLQLGFNVDQTHKDYPKLVTEFLDHYKQIHLNTAYFSGIEKVLEYLEENNLTWGIVTNRPTDLTAEFLTTKSFKHRPACVVCGDTLKHRKPHPATILHACKLLNLTPEACLYVGDTETDVIASKAAGTRSLVVLYGYTGKDEQPHSWGADGYVGEAIGIIDWLENSGS